MSDLAVAGFKASDVIVDIDKAFSTFSEKEKKDFVNKTKGIFELRITNDDKQEAVWTIDMKKEGTVVKGAVAKPKPDVIIILSDETFMLLASGKLTGQKAFMTGKLKTKGNMMLATKLENVLKVAKGKQAKL
ncbi:hypothetical protein ONZ45_g8656 [Pleurotus djamor]|nr:hypothetical protein ONZ45_g8656 [Pleurotus djamor]